MDPASAFEPPFDALLPQLAAALRKQAAASRGKAVADDEQEVANKLADDVQLKGPQQPFVGPYELVRRIGEGGVATVYRARHLHPEYAARPTAIKLLHPAHRADGRLLNLFRREADVLSLIKHSNVVETFDAGQDGACMYLGMEFVPGTDLSHFLWRCQQKGVRVPVALLVFVAREVLGGLAYAHGLHDLGERPLNLVHRDVNPANVLLSYTGEVKLSDFGVASVRFGGDANPQELAGKAGYFAPEQLGGAPVLPHGDIYALGATLYEMLAGAPLFGQGDADAVMAANRANQLPAEADFLPQIDPALAAVVRQALARDPSQRYASASAMSAALLPWTPEPRQASRLLAALMQQMFYPEHQREQVLQRRLAGLPEPTAAALRAPARLAGEVREGGSRQLPAAVDVVVQEPVAAGALVQVLEAKGWEVQQFDDLKTWMQVRGGLHPPAPVAIVDAEIADLDAQRQCAQEMHVLVRHLQVLCMGQAFSFDAAAKATAWQARELWVPPFAVERVTGGVAAAYAAAHQVADGASVVATRGTGQQLAVLLVAASEAFAAAARAEATARGDQLTQVQSLAAALALTDEASFDLLVVQTPGRLGEMRGQLTQYRAAWGMGDVPCLWSLPAGTQASDEVLPQRSAWQLWGLGWREPLAEAYASAAAGQVRAFSRYAVRLRVGLRVGGQVMEAQTLNVSRRGLLIETVNLPSVGTEVMLSLYLPNQDVVQVRGKTLRVAMAPPSGAQAALPPQPSAASVRLGVAMGPFVRDGERTWLRWLATLAAAEAATQAAPASPGRWQRVRRLFGRRR